MRWTVLAVVAAFLARSPTLVRTQSNQTDLLPTPADWQWFDGKGDVALETFMPMQRAGRSLVRYRMHHPLHTSLQERFFDIAGEERVGNVTATVVAPMGDSIQWQLVTGHMKSPTTTFEALLARIAVRRLRLDSGSCPAIRRRLESLPDVPLKPLPQNTVMIDPTHHEFKVDLGIVKMSATIYGGPLARWAGETFEALLACQRRPQ